jgi:hypothetical protein
VENLGSFVVDEEESILVGVGLNEMNLGRIYKISPQDEKKEIFY